jgi:DNA-binding transcriptional ArsR family regulator
MAKAPQPHELFHLLSDPTRLRILSLLRQRSLCVKDLVEIIRARQPAISNHLRKLLHFGLVSRTPNGHRFVSYSLAPAGDRVTAKALELLADSRRQSSRLARDAAALKARKKKTRLSPAALG